MRVKKPHPLSAKLLKDFRKKTGLHQEQFINKYNIDVSQSVFSRWERGQIAVPVSVLLDLGLLKEV